MELHPQEGQGNAQVVVARPLTYGTGGPDDNTTVITGEADFNLQAGLAFPVRVLEPPHPVPLVPPAAERNQPLAAEARTNCSTPSCKATLYWLPAGGSWRSQPMTAQQVTIDGQQLLRLTATIPRADTAGTRLSYRVEVNDGYVTESTPTLPVVLDDQASPATVGGQLFWWDLAVDRIRGPHEPRITGARLTLTAAGLDGRFGTLDDLPPATQDSDADGLYQFSRLLPGKYRLVASGLPIGVDTGCETSSREFTLAIGERRSEIFAYPPADVDGDGVLDVVEHRFGVAAGSADTDGDGLTDGFELGDTAVALLSVAKADTDGDGAPDGREDEDGDGLDNLAEQAAAPTSRMPTPTTTASTTAPRPLPTAPIPRRPTPTATEWERRRGPQRPQPCPGRQRRRRRTR